MTGAVGNIAVPKPEPVGIGGWLILPIIGFFAAIAITLFNLYGVVESFDGIVMIFEATSGPLTELKIPLVLSMIGGPAVIASAAACLILVFRKKSQIVQVATAHYLILLAVNIIEVWVDAKISEALPGTPTDPQIMKGAIRALVAVFIWIPYFHLSKRVRNTFQTPIVGHKELASPAVTTPSDTNNG